jgi:hypothetical protein
VIRPKANRLAQIESPVNPTPHEIARRFAPVTILVNGRAAFLSGTFPLHLSFCVRHSRGNP